MALSDYKIPIIAGRNDVPTTSESDPDHPNGSFITKKFNDLIDNELTALQQAIAPSPNRINLVYVDKYVDATTGNDSTGDGTEALPYATINRALQDYKGKNCLDCSIIITGTFTNQIFDCRDIYPVHSQCLGDIVEPTITIRNGGTNLSDAVLTYNYNFNDTTYESTDTPHSIVLGSLNFQGIVFNVLGNDDVNLNSATSAFSNCTFDGTNRTSVNNANSCLLRVDNSNLRFTDCTFALNDTKDYYAILGQHNNLYLSNNTLTNAGSLDVAYLYTKYSTLYLSATNTAWANNNINQCIVFRDNASVTVDDNNLIQTISTI